MSVKDRPRLGRGLKALITSPVVVNVPAAGEAVASPTSDVGQGAAGERLMLVDITKIDANPYQPRETMDPRNLSELVASIKVSGVLQPIILRPAASGRFQLVAGHRRTEAARAAGLTVIPAVVRGDSTEEQQAEWALVENIQREDLNPIERAKAYKTYVTKFGLTHAQAAERLGEERVTISNYLRMLDLGEATQSLVATGQLSAGHAKVLAGVTDVQRQQALAQQVAAEGLSVRKLEELVNGPAVPPIAAGETTTQVAGHSRTLVAKSAHIVELEQELSRKLGTKLRIFPSKKKNTGKLVIQYFSLDEFDRIIEKFN